MDGQRRFASLAVQEEEGSINLEQKLIDQTEALRVHKVLHVLNEPYKEVFYA
ncbi:hypothetical protein D3C71_2033170 [compost metagenome]